MRSKKIVLAVLLVVTLGVTVGARPVPSFSRPVIVHVEVPPLAWSGSKLETMLLRELTRKGNEHIVSSQSLPLEEAAFPTDYLSLDSVVDWGTEMGGKYVIVVKVDDERLERRKSFHFPLLFHRYRTIGVIEGELRVVDISRRKLLLAEPFHIEEKGAQIFQATMDDNVHDPDIHLTAPAKIRFFEHLEEKLAKKLSRRIKKVIRIR